MSKDWQVILRFALVVLAVAAIYLVFSRTDHPAEIWAGVVMFWASLLICPGLFVFNLIVAGAELPIRDTGLVWLVIALTNCLFYSTLGLIYVDFRGRRGNPAGI